MPWFVNITRKDGDKEIVGTYLTAFIYDGSNYILTDIKIYADAKVYIWDLVDLEKFKERVRNESVVTRLPEGANVIISLLTSFIVRDVHSYVDPEEFIKEVADEIERLSGRPTAQERTHSAYKLFQAEQSEAARENLQQAYEAIPGHLRRFALNNMDVQDVPIRMIIYGANEIEKWTHRTIGRELGVKPLPTLHVPGAKPAPKNWWQFWS